MSDLISREDAIAEVSKEFKNSIIGTHCAVNAIYRVPSAEREKGRWVNQPYEKGLYVHICSNCLKASGIGGGDLWFNFCPNCGADMRGEEDE